MNLTSPVPLVGPAEGGSAGVRAAPRVSARGKAPSAPSNQALANGIYTELVSALSDYLRERAADDVRRMSPQERVSLALRLGDEDLALFCAANRVEPDVARRHVARQRQTKRRASACAAC